MQGAADNKLPAHLETQRTRVILNNDSPASTMTPYAFDAYASLGYDNSFDLEQFKNNFKIEIRSKTEDEIVFDMIGVEAPIANAFRRIMIAEVPTMAIEHVYIMNNTSLIQDEVLAHRIGLIPIKVDPRLFQFREEGQDPNDKDTLVFSLNVRCTRNLGISDDAPEEKKYNNSRVLSGDLVWQPQGDQGTDLFPLPEVKPVFPDILLAKLRPGQSIELQAHCVKGIGREHAKWSPVGTASYRLMPDIVIPKPLFDAEADSLVASCPMKVFDIEDLMSDSKHHQRKAVVARPLNCTMCRECIRDHPKRVLLMKKKDHFIFSVESVGILPADILFTEAVKILMEKCVAVMQQLEETPTRQ